MIGSAAKTAGAHRACRRTVRPHGIHRPLEIRNSLSLNIAPMCWCLAWVPSGSRIRMHRPDRVCPHPTGRKHPRPIILHASGRRRKPGNEMPGLLHAARTEAITARAIRHQLQIPVGLSQRCKGEPRRAAVVCPVQRRATYSKRDPLRLPAPSTLTATAARGWIDHARCC